MAFLRLLARFFSLAIFFRHKFLPRSEKCQNNFANREKVFVNFCKFTLTSTSPSDTKPGTPKKFEPHRSFSSKKSLRGEVW